MSGHLQSEDDNIGFRGDMTYNDFSATIQELIYDSKCHIRLGEGLDHF